jgi:hypothetical protein
VCAWLGLFAGTAGSVRAQLLSPGPLSQAHHQLEGDDQCQRCHASGSQVVESRCNDCHKDIGLERGKALGLHGKTFRGQPCSQCHAEHLGPKVSLVRWPGPDPSKFDHAQTGFLLHGKHAQATCTKCHDKKNARGVATYLGLSKDCASCHKEPHQKRFGSRCTDCHDDKSWFSLDLDEFEHDLARFQVHGAHERVECAGCHGKPPQFTKLEFNDCVSCHEDPHKGQFKAACSSCHTDEAWTRVNMQRDKHPGLSLANGHAKTPCASCHDRGLLVAPSKGATCVSCHAPVHDAPFGNRCEDCHASIRWLDLPESIGRTAHAKTAFVLRGEHGRTACASCHKPELPRAQRYRGLSFNQCASCHADVHAGKLAKYGDCSLCHDLLGFAPSLVETPTHAKFAFALEGNHEATACSGCHKQAHTGKRVNWSIADHECQSCHENPHGTQFALEMSNGGCGHCHAPAGWGLPNIDHSFWPLTGAHGGAACSECHKPSEVDRKAGKGASYKGVPRECAGCHDDAHAGQFRTSQPKRECQECHGTIHFTLPFFDHAALTGYTLEGKHTETPCASCHAPVHLRNGDEVTLYRLGYSKCADCHADPHSLPGGKR